MHHYSPHFLDLLTLIHDGALLVYYLVVVVVVAAAAENAPEISWEGTAVVVQHQQQQPLLLFQVPSLIGNQCNSSTNDAGKKDSDEVNKLSRVAVYNPADAAAVNIELHLDLGTCCHIEVLDSIDYNANADYDDPAAAVDAVFDKTGHNLNSLQRQSFLHLPGPVLELFGVSDPVVLVRRFNRTDMWKSEHKLYCAAINN